MHNDVAFLAAHDVALLPREVVVVFQVEEDLQAQVLGDVLVDERVVGGCVLAHQLHRGPVFLAFGGIEREPGEVLVLLRQVRVLLHRELAVVVAHRRAGAATPAVREERNVFAGRQTVDGLTRSKDTELDEVVAAATGAEL